MFLQNVTPHTDYVAMAKEDILNFQTSNHFNLPTLPIFLRGDMCVSLWISVVKGDFLKISYSFQRTSVIAEISVKGLLAKYGKKKPTPYHKHTVPTTPTNTHKT